MNIGVRRQTYRIAHAISHLQGVNDAKRQIISEPQIER